MKNLHCVVIAFILFVPAMMLGCDNSSTTEVSPLEDKSIYEEEEARFEAETRAETESSGGV